MNVTYATFFARDVDTMAEFYIAALGLEEIAASRDHRYREVTAGPIKIGFMHQGAYQMLNIVDQADPTGLRSIVTFDAGTADAVQSATDRAVGAGAVLLKPPTETFFGQYQSVLRDPEGNAFRISAAVAA